MEPAKREVLRRKKPIIVEILDFSPPLQKVYRQLGILNDKMVAEVMVRTEKKLTDNTGTS